MGDAERSEEAAELEKARDGIETQRWARMTRVRRNAIKKVKREVSMNWLIKTAAIIVATASLSAVLQRKKHLFASL